MKRINTNASMSDVLSEACQRDVCVVLPTLDHALYWWPRVHDMFADRQTVMRSKTGLVLRGSRTLVRLWVPYSRDPTMPMDFIQREVFEMYYMLLYGLSRKGDIKWLR